MSRRLLALSVIVLLLFGSISSSGAETADLAQETVGELQKAADSAQETANSQKSTDSSVKETTAAAVKSLTLDEAVELAIKNNIDLKKAQLDYDNAVIDARQARYNAGEIDEDSVNSLQTAQTKYVSTKQKVLAEEIAKQTYEITIEQTKNLVEENYYDVLMADNLVKVKEASVKRAQEQLALVQKKFKAGTAIKTEVNKAEISSASAKADLTNAQRDLKNVQVVLNKTLGLDVNTDIKLTQVLKYEKITLPTPEDLTKQALETRLDMKRAKNSESIAQMTYDLVVAYQAPNTFSAKKQKIELEKAKLVLLQQEQNIRAEVISTLFQVQKADEVVQLSAKSLEQAKENYSLTERRYEIRVGTFADVLSATVDLADAEAKYIQAVYNYSTTKNKLKTVVVVSK